MGSHEQATRFIMYVTMSNYHIGIALRKQK